MTEMEPFWVTTLGFFVPVVLFLSKIALAIAIALGTLALLALFYEACEQRGVVWVARLANVFAAILAVSLMLAAIGALIDRSENPGKYKVKPVPAEAPLQR